RFASLAAQGRVVPRPAPLLLLDVDDVQSGDLLTEVRLHLSGVVPYDQRQPIVRHGAAAPDEQLLQRMLEEGLQAHRVHALLQVRTEASQARAVPGSEADEVHAAKVNTYR